MTCDAMSERLPAVAAGRAAWNEEEQRHLAECARCTAEWDLVRRTAALGASLPMDAERISARVLGRLAAAPAPARPRWPLLAAGVLTAAAALLLVLRSSGAGAGDPGIPATVLAIPINELDSLTNEQLRLVLDAIEEPLETPSTVEVPSMMELDDQQLERVLRSLEG
jgi:hypothetical protein